MAPTPAIPRAIKVSVAGSGTVLNSILMFEKSIPLFAVLGVFDDPKILALTWNPSKSKAVALGLESLVVKVLNTLELSLNEPDRSIPDAVLVIEYVPV